MFTEKEEKQIRNMLELHLQRMKTHSLSFKMEGKKIDDPPLKPVVQQHAVEAGKCRTIIEKIINEEKL